MKRRDQHAGPGSPDRGKRRPEEQASRSTEHAGPPEQTAQDTQRGTTGAKALPQRDPGPGGTSFQDSWFGNIPAGFLVSAVFLYICGWSYIYGYYTAFGLSLGEVSFDLNETMIFAQRGFPRLLLVAVAAISLLCLAGLVWSQIDIKVMRPSFARRLSVSFLCFSLAILLLERVLVHAIHRGRVDAMSDMDASKSLLPLTELVVDASKLHQFAVNPAEGTIHGNLLVHGRAGYYLLPRLLKERAKGTRPAGNIEVIFIPEGAVLGERLVTGIEEGK